MTEARKRSESLRPAFSGLLPAALFAGLVLLLLVSPVLISSTGLVSRENSYEQMTEHLGPYQYIRQEIYDKDEDIDILFLGTSVLWSAVDTPRVRNALSEKLGRKAEVITLGFNFHSIDMLYSILRDVTENRKVRMVIISIPREREVLARGPSLPYCKFVRYGDDGDILDDVPAASKLALYGCNVLRTPQDLLAMARPNLHGRSQYEATYGWNREELGLLYDAEAFVRYRPEPKRFPVEEMIRDISEQAEFRYSKEQLPSTQARFLVEWVRLVEDRKIPLVMLNTPQITESRSDKIVAFRNWSGEFGHEVPFIGVTPAKLFEGMSDEQVRNLYFEQDHFNLNGSEFFTETVLPAILEMYERHADKTN